MPIYDKVELFDPTGAGDSFAGAFVGYLSKYGEKNLKEEQQKRIQNNKKRQYNCRRS